MTAESRGDPSTIPVARSAWMPPRFYLLCTLVGSALRP